MNKFFVVLVGVLLFLGIVSINFVGVDEVDVVDGTGSVDSVVLEPVGPVCVLSDAELDDLCGVDS